MNARERLNKILKFQRDVDRGSVQETFIPWELTVERWINEGLPTELVENLWKPKGVNLTWTDQFMRWFWADGVYNYEQYFGLDGLKRLFFGIPLSGFDNKIIEETEDYEQTQNFDGSHVKTDKKSGVKTKVKQPVESAEDWYKIKASTQKFIEKHFTDENIQRIFMPFRERHQKGEYSIMMEIKGFFDTPRNLFGIENHLYAFYDFPEIMHEINEFLIEFYFNKLGNVLDFLPVDVLYIVEDLSGKNGSMISPKHFDEFIGAYYKRLVPFLKEHGVHHIFVDTDGDFTGLIPNFLEVGIEGFLPLDVNAGVDVVELRKNYPNVKLIGGFNKLCISKGKNAIDSEFERLLPVIRQGGYIPGVDHQVAPSTSLEYYLYYIERLRQIMMDVYSS